MGSKWDQSSTNWCFEKNASIHSFANNTPSEIPTKTKERCIFTSLIYFQNRLMHSTIVFSIVRKTDLPRFASLSSFCVFFPWASRLDGLLPFAAIDVQPTWNGRCGTYGCYIWAVPTLWLSNRTQKQWNYVELWYVPVIDRDPEKGLSFSPTV